MFGTGTSTARVYAAFGGAVVIGGANYIAVSVSNLTVPPLFGAGMRFGLAALLFVLIASAWRVPWARGRQAMGAALYGLLGFGAAYALIYYALVGLNAGTVAVIMAAVPLFTLGIATAAGQERPTLRGLLGAGLAVVGIAILSADALDAGGGISYLVAGILACAAAAGSSVIARRFRDVHPVAMNAQGMAAGTALLLLGSIALDEPWALPASSGAILATVWLVVAGSVGLFLLFLFVMRRWTASATVYALAGMPVIAVALGTVLLDQPVTPQLLVGGTVVLVAVYVGAIRSPEAPRGVPGPTAREHPK